MTHFRVFRLWVLLCLVSVPTFAQSTVSGRVTDPLGGSVADAAVTLRSPGGGAPRTGTTGSDGAFIFPDVSPGGYVVVVDALGFQRWTRAIEVTSGSAPLEIVLPIPGFAESVAVTAPKLEEELPQELAKTGVRVQTITSAQIENGGYYDVSQALQALVPGLFLQPKAGPFDYVDASLQGSRTNEILWLVDGVRISNRLYNGTTPLDTIPAHMIERIEIVEGGHGLFYGTQAVAGAINVVTKSFADTANGRVQAGFDTNRGGHVNLFARQALGAHRFVLFGSKDDARGYQSFPAGQYQASSTDRRRGYDVAAFGGKYAYDFSRAVRLSAMYQVNDARLDNLRPGRSGTGHVGGLSAGFNERTEHILNAKVDYTPRRDTELFFKTYYHHWDSYFSETRNVIGAPGTSRVAADRAFWGFKDYGASVLAKLTPTRGFEYFAGYDFQNYRGRDDFLLIAPNTETVHALFGQLRTTRALFEKATFAFGARANAPSNAKGAGVWNASGQYDITSASFVRGTAGTSFRYPDAYELFAIDPDCCVGNRNLDPERSTNVNGSIGHRLAVGDSQLTLEAVGFYRRVTDLIVDIDDGTGSGNTVTANQADIVRVHGLSLIGSATITPALAGSLSYTYNRSQKNELAGGYTGIAGIPSNQVDVTIDFHPTDMPFGAMLAVNHVGQLFNTVPVFGDVAAGNYTVVDLSGRYLFGPRRRHRINVRLENLFDAEYTTRNARNFFDQSSTPFLVNFLGVPRTLHVSYSVGF